MINEDQITRDLATTELTASPTTKTKTGGDKMTNSPTALIKAFLITTTALGLVPCTTSTLHAQAAETTEPLMATTGFETQSSEDIPTSSNIQGNATKATEDNAGTASSTSAISRSITATDSQAAAAEIQPTRSTTAADDRNTIIVTGTHIRGTAAAGAKVDVYSSEDIDTSGYATIQEFMNTIPQNFKGGGGNEDAASGELLSSNRFSGAAINLRGLGADSTLVLINGRRIPSSGLDANFTDISLIPQSAIERVEVLTDGASAIYGSDAIGGVVNIVLRSDFDGLESRLRYGTVTNGSLDEYRASQTIGRSWGGGNIVFNLEYYRRENLPNAERRFAASNDLRPFGGGDYRNEFSSPGNILDPQTGLPAFAIPTGQNGRSLTVAQLLPGQVNRQNGLLGQDLLPKQTRISAFISAEQEISDNLELFFELRANQRKVLNRLGAETSILSVPSDNPFYIDPFNSDPLNPEPVSIAYSFVNDLGPTNEKGRVRSGAIIAGLKTLISEWRIEGFGAIATERSNLSQGGLNFTALDAALADRNPSTAFNPFGDGGDNNAGTLASLRQIDKVRPRSRMKNIHLVADGPLRITDEIEPSLALGADYRNEFFRTQTILGANPLQPGRYHRNIYAIFSELYIPILPQPKDNGLFRKFDLSIAARFEKYSDVGSTTNPKVGATFGLTRFFETGATYGTSFRAPNLREVDTTSNGISLVSLPDPQAPSGFTRTLVLTGNDPDLEHETAKTWTASISTVPKSTWGINAHINYFSISFKDRISRLPSLSGAFFNEALYSELITRNPNRATLQAYCSQPIFRGASTQCTPGLVGAIVDGRLQNLSRYKIEGIDLSINRQWKVAQSRVSLGLSSTYLINFRVKPTDTSPSVELVDTLGSPVDLRARAHAAISNDIFSITTFVNYTDSYENQISPLQGRINSHTTVDLNSTIDVGQAFKIGRPNQFNLSLSAINIFNNKPPFADNLTGQGYDDANADPLGRFISAELRISW